MKIVVCALAMFALSGCASVTTDQAQSHDQCRILADVASELGADNYDPKVHGGRDCSQTFAAAGLPMLGLKKPGDAEGGPGLAHITQFEAPQAIDADTMRIRLSFTCPRLCGHGEEVTARYQSGRWVIADRKTTWMS